MALFFQMLSIRTPWIVYGLVTWLTIPALSKTIDIERNGMLRSDMGTVVRNLQKGDILEFASDGQRFVYQGTVRMGGTTYVLKVRAKNGNPAGNLALRIPISGLSSHVLNQVYNRRSVPKDAPVVDFTYVNEGVAVAASEWYNQLELLPDLLVRELSPKLQEKLVSELVILGQFLSEYVVGDLGVRQIGFDHSTQKLVLFDYDFLKKRRGRRALNGLEALFGKLDQSELLESSELVKRAYTEIEIVNRNVLCRRLFVN